MIEIKKNSLEERILRILMDRYPVRASELRKELKVKDSIIKNSLNKLCSKGIIELEILPDETFIQLIRRDLRFSGVNPAQRKRLIEKKSKGAKIKDYEGMAYR